MKVVIRADASTSIGTGHVMRCLTLAEELRQRGSEVIFLSQNLPGNLVDAVNRRNFKAYLLPYTENYIEDGINTINILKNMGSINYLIVDHYQLDISWHQIMRSYCHKILVIDDLADRQYDCDLLLDQNLLPHKELRYEGKLPSHCQQLLGFDYLLLRSEFLHTHQIKINIPPIAKRLLITMGGSDPLNATTKVLRSLENIKVPLDVRVAIGHTCPHRESIQDIAKNLLQHQVHLQLDVTEMANWMAWADLAICAGGFTIYELSYMGVPTLVTTVSSTQTKISQEMDHLKLNQWLGMIETINIHDLNKTILKLIENLQLRKNLIQNGQAKIDGQGTQRVTDRILKMA